MALAGRLAPHAGQKRLSAATAVPHTEQRVEGMGAREFYLYASAVFVVFAPFAVFFRPVVRSA